MTSVLRESCINDLLYYSLLIYQAILITITFKCMSSSKPLLFFPPCFDFPSQQVKSFASYFSLLSSLPTAVHTGSNAMNLTMSNVFSPSVHSSTLPGVRVNHQSILTESTGYSGIVRGQNEVNGSNGGKENTQDLVWNNPNVISNPKASFAMFFSDLKNDAISVDGEEKKSIEESKIDGLILCAFPGTRVVVEDMITFLNSFPNIDFYGTLPVSLFTLETQRESMDYVMSTIRSLLRGKRISCSKIEGLERLSYEWLIAAMGGVYDPNFSPSVTHLITNFSISKKYETAVQHRIPITSNKWLIENINTLKLQNVKAFPPLLLQGKIICITGFDLDEKDEMERVVTMYGGIFSKNLEMRTSLLIAANPKGEKYDYALLWQIPVVSERWFRELRDNGRVGEAENYSLTFEYALQAYGKSPDEILFESCHFTVIDETLMSNVNHSLSASSSMFTILKLLRSGAMYYSHQYFLSNPLGLLASVISKIKNTASPTITALQNQFAALGSCVPFSPLTHIFATDFEAVKIWWANLLQAATLQLSASFPMNTITSLLVDIPSHIPIISSHWVDKCVEMQLQVDCGPYLISKIVKRSSPDSVASALNQDLELEDCPKPLSSNFAKNQNAKLPGKEQGSMEKLFFFHLNFLLAPSVAQVSPTLSRLITDNGGLCIKSAASKYDILICTSVVEAVQILEQGNLPIVFYEEYGKGCPFIATPEWCKDAATRNQFLPLFSSQHYVPTPVWNASRSGVIDIAANRSMLFSSTGFRDSKDIMDGWILAAGAESKATLNKHCSYLIVDAKQAGEENKKLVGARKWNIPERSLNWLFNSIIAGMWLPNEVGTNLILRNPDSKSHSVPVQSLGLTNALTRSLSDALQKIVTEKKQVGQSVTGLSNFSPALTEPISQPPAAVENDSGPQGGVIVVSPLNVTKSSETNSASAIRQKLAHSNVRTSLGSLGKNLKVDDELRILEIVSPADHDTAGITDVWVPEVKKLNMDDVDDDSVLAENRSSVKRVAKRKTDIGEKSPTSKKGKKSKTSSNLTFALSGFRSPEKDELMDQIVSLGGKLCETDEQFVNECDFLIVFDLIRSEKVFLAILSRKPILKQSYLSQCVVEKTFGIDYTEHMFQNFKLSPSDQSPAALIVHSIHFWNQNSFCDLPSIFNLQMPNKLPSKFAVPFQGLEILSLLLEPSHSSFNRVLTTGGAKFHSHEEMECITSFHCAIFDVSKSDTDFVNIFKELSRRKVLCLRKDFFTDFIIYSGNVQMDNYVLSIKDFESKATLTKKK